MLCRGPKRPEDGEECELRWSGEFLEKLSLMLKDAWAMMGASVPNVPLTGTMANMPPLTNLAPHEPLCLWFSLWCSSMMLSKWGHWVRPWRQLVWSPWSCFLLVLPPWYLINLVWKQRAGFGTSNALCLVFVFKSSISDMKKTTTPN